MYGPPLTFGYPSPSVGNLYSCRIPLRRTTFFAKGGMRYAVHARCAPVNGRHAGHAFDSVVHLGEQIWTAVFYHLCILLRYFFHFNSMMACQLMDIIREQRKKLNERAREVYIDRVPKLKQPANTQVTVGAGRSLPTATAFTAIENSNEVKCSGGLLIHAFSS